MTPLPEEHLQPGHFTSQYNISLYNTSTCNQATSLHRHCATLAAASEPVKRQFTVHRDEHCATLIYGTIVRLLLVNPAWDQHLQHSRRTLTTLTTLYPPPTSCPKARFPTPAQRCNTDGHCLCLCLPSTKLPSSESRKQYILESTTKKLNNHWFALNLSSLRCLSVYPVRLLCDRKNTWALATINTSKQQLSPVSHKFDISLFLPLPRYWVFSLKFRSDRGKHL